MHITRDELEPPKRASNKPQANEVTREWIDALVEGVAEVISEEAARRKKLGARFVALERHVAELETVSGRVRSRRVLPRSSSARPISSMSACLWTAPVISRAIL